MPDGFITQNSGKAARLNSAGSLLFAVSLAAFTGLLLLSGVVYAGRFLYAKRIDAARASMAKFSGLDEHQIKPILDTDKKLSMLKAALDGHTMPSAIFKFLEDNTLKEVRYTTFNFASDSRRIDFAGEASSYNAVAQQVRAFEGMTQYVERVEFGGLGLSNSDANEFVKFKMTVILTPNLTIFREGNQP